MISSSAIQKLGKAAPRAAKAMSAVSQNAPTWRTASQPRSKTGEADSAIEARARASVKGSRSKIRALTGR